MINNVNIVAAGGIGIIEALKNIPINDETIGLAIQIGIGVITIVKIIISKQTPLSKESIKPFINIFRGVKRLKQISKEQQKEDNDEQAK